MTIIYGAVIFDKGIIGVSLCEYMEKAISFSFGKCELLFFFPPDMIGQPQFHLGTTTTVKICRHKTFFNFLKILLTLNV